MSSGAMWRSCLCLRDGWRRLLNRPSGGPTASVGKGANIPFPFRAYAPPAERKRFYQNVTITQGEGGFEINLDHRKLKTPQAKLFTVPSEALAIAVATEWDSQQDTIKFYTMHLTTLCNTSLDNPTQRNKDQLIRAAVKFLDTDTICYRVEEPETLVELQKNEWDPILEWAEKRSRSGATWNGPMTMSCGSSGHARPQAPSLSTSAPRAPRSSTSSCRSEAGGAHGTPGTEAADARLPGLRTHGLAATRCRLGA
ncbi:ATP synthase mitochondrial F1 complex assembly factor 2 isoform X3 [Myotis myotis]|uniref:ATP synthase mitochondrial F1 complex assembly factor 2 isoform X3 n=1 Tax=Myotis myotis TaxID=51298 RepID=UPI00174E9936|nr:ATP synthase mitochondrial F1 complex assembly factor 2 isoform X3 [Myotis myotis]